MLAMHVWWLWAWHCIDNPVRSWWIHIVEWHRCYKPPTLSCQRLIQQWSSVDENCSDLIRSVMSETWADSRTSCVHLYVMYKTSVCSKCLLYTASVPGFDTKPGLKLQLRRFTGCKIMTEIKLEEDRGAMSVVTIYCTFITQVHT